MHTLHDIRSVVTPAHRHRNGESPVPGQAAEPLVEKHLSSQGLREMEDFEALWVLTTFLFRRKPGLRGYRASESFLADFPLILPRMYM